MSKPTDLVQGTLDLLILKVIASQPLHGWGIAQRISLISNDVLQVGQGWISSKWGESENSRRAR
jgi:DNA-binding PadR family transcriptional regulator